ncbi:AaceriAEL112Cp [[Ashbya] aceris (nom. inval.)]|nr:AaceriAEL112Cp [[Ashbya] aceris (nom. inval.)]
MEAARIKLDETTYYSLLGLPFGAPELHIRKAYMRLARELHPDKSKSKEAAELFKVVAHAHSVLTDKDKRLKYDRQLVAKGLHTYVSNSSSSPNYKSPVSRPVTRAQQAAVAADKERAAKKAKPYEEQPYGFGTEAESIPQAGEGTPQRSTTAAKPFKAKSYQHQRNPGTPPETGNKKSSTFSARFISSNNVPAAPENKPSDEYPAKKMPRKQATPEPSSSPFLSPDHRHYARTKFESRRRGTRSTSPLKTMPTSQTDTLDGLKNIINKFSDKVKVNIFGSPSTLETEPTAELPEDQSSIEQDGVDESKVRADMLSSDKATGPHVPGQQENAKEINLDELNTSLPPQRETFNMRNVSDTLDRMNVKRQKLNTEAAHIASSIPLSVQRHPSPAADESGSLAEPVNKSIPRVYKIDRIPPAEFAMDLSVSNIELPPMPSFHCNILDKSDIKLCREKILEFNTKMNRLKRQLIQVLALRSSADEALESRVVRVENMAAYVEAKNYDLDVVMKLHEIQNRQRIVAESFTNLMRSAYASGTF